jgi:hypothetical protein
LRPLHYLRPLHPELVEGCGRAWPSRCAGPALTLLLTVALLVSPVSAAGDASEARPRAEASESAPTCSACTGSAVKSWRIRKGDPKRPPETKPLKDKDKETGKGGLAE